MTASSHEKVFKQLKVKPWILKKYKKHNSPKARTCGVNTKKCTRCGRRGAVLGQYGLMVCRQCFRENSKELGFTQYS